jgi:hypothetical protein
MDTTVLSPSIVGQAEKAHGAILRKVLAGTGLDEQQWITLQLAQAPGTGIRRTDLVTRVSAAAKFDPPVIDRAISALISSSFIDQHPDDRLLVSQQGRELVSALRERIGEHIGSAYGSVPPEDLATAARVLTTITARLSAELAAS